jgi:hypothetical protein
VIVVAVIEILDVPEPLMVPLADATGKTIVLVKLKVLPLIFSMPFVCVNVPDTVKFVPKVIVCPEQFNVKFLRVNPPAVKNKVFVTLPAEMIRSDAAEPVMVPLAAAAGKITVPLKVSICPFNLTIPFVCVYIPLTVTAVPRVNVKPGLFSVKLFNVCAPTVIKKLLVMVVAEIKRLEAPEPEVVPFATDEAKLAVPVNVSVFPLILIIPLVCV